MCFCVCLLGSLQTLWRVCTCTAEVMTCPPSLWVHDVLQIPQKFRSPCHPHTSRVSKGCQGTHGEASRTACAWVFSGWLPSRLATLSFAQVCSLEKASHKMPALFPGKSKVLLVPSPKSGSSGCSLRTVYPSAPSLSTNMLPKCWGKSLEHC